MASTIITYIHHDCFLISIGDCVIIFDFWIDPTVDPDSEPRFLEMIDPGKEIYVIVSHHHKDHFTRRIFDWSQRFPEIKYIVSRDVAKACRHLLSPTSVYNGVKPRRDQVITLRPGEDYIDGDFHIRAFRSTDIGNSYLISTRGENIFHAGDLNAWIWKEESTQREVDQAIRGFRSILSDIVNALEAHPIDYCFFPVDSRIGSEYWTGARIFLEEVSVRRFFPMHFGLGDEREQLLRRLHASESERYLPSGRDIEVIGPLAPYGRYVAISQTHDDNIRMEYPNPENNY